MFDRDWRPGNPVFDDLEFERTRSVEAALHTKEEKMTVETVDTEAKPACPKILPG